MLSPGQAEPDDLLVAGQLGLDRVQVADRIAAGLVRRAVEHVHQRRAAFDVLEEVMAEALALARAGDQAGHVRDDELDLARLDHAEVRDQGGEGVVGDLRPGGGHGGDQAGLARVGEADEADIGHRLELQGEVAGIPRLALEREARGLAARRRERRVAESAPAARRGDVLGAGPHQVGEHLSVAGENHRAVRDLDYQIFTGGAVAVRPLALTAVPGLPDRAAVKVEQRRAGRVDLEDHAAAAAAVAAVGAAERLELLPVDRCAAVPAMAGLHL